MTEPKWITVARSKIGEREIPGPRNNGWIVSTWAKLGASWFNSEDVPWCGMFVAYCMQAVGIPYPGKGAFARAAAWADWGKPLSVARYGCVAVKKRPGGNHVFFVIGETPDKRYYKALGGNQSNAVTIMDVAKADVFALRWPATEMLPRRDPLPVMQPGVISTNEA